MSTGTSLIQTDRELQHRVRNALYDRRLLKNDDVAIATTNGTVTLTGRVKSYYARQLVVHCCLHVPGVRNVVDEIGVGTQETLRSR